MNLKRRRHGVIAQQSLLWQPESRVMLVVLRFITMTRIALTTNSMQHGRVQHLPEWKYLLLAKA